MYAAAPQPGTESENSRLPHVDKKEGFEEEKKEQIEAQAKEISQTLKVWDETGEYLDAKTTAVYQNILYNTLIGDNSWINQVDLQVGCNIAKSFLKCDDLKRVAAAPLIILANELAQRGHCLPEFLPICLQELDTENEKLHAETTAVMHQFVSNNIGIDELAKIAHSAHASDDDSIQKRSLNAYNFLSLHESYQAKTIEAAFNGIKSKNKEIRKKAAEILINLVLKRIPLPSDVVLFLINYKKATFRDLFAAQGRYLDLCFNMLNAKHHNKKLDIEELRTLIYLLLNNYRTDDVKEMGQAALTKYQSWKSKHQITNDDWLDIDVFLELFDPIEFVVNQDYSRWTKAKSVCDENDQFLVDHVNVTKCLNALFSKDNKCSTKDQINAFIDEIRLAYATMGVDQNLTSNLFIKFYRK